MMRAMMWVVLAAAVVASTGCSTVLDARGESEVCEIHHTYMQSVEVSAPSDTKQRTQEYLEARMKFFRHSYPSALPERIRTKYVVYLCDKCVKAEADWKKEHPPVKN
jgi:hypothetical protein